MPNYDDIADQMAAQQAAAGAPANKYDSITQQMRDEQDRTAGQAALAVQFSTDQNPDQAAVNNALAKRYNTTPDAVAAYPKEFRDRMALEIARSNLRDAPQLQRQIATNPATAALIHDDIPNAAAIEKTLAALPGANLTQWDGPAGPTYRERLSDWWRGLFGAPSVADERQQQQAAQATAILASRQPGMTDDQALEASRQAVGGMSQIPVLAAQRFIDSASFGLVAPTDPMQPHSWQASTAGALGQLAGFMTGPAKAAGALINPIERTAGEGFLRGLSRNVVNEAATLALASAAEKGGHAALDSQNLGQAAKTEGDALIGGATAGASFGVAKRLLPGNSLPQWLGRFALVSAGQDASEGTSPLDERVPLEDRLFKYFMNAAFTLHGDAASPHAQVIQEFAASKLAEQDFQHLSTLSQLSAASKWRERDPEGFHERVRMLSDDGAPNVYVEAKAFAQAMDKTGVPLDEVRQQLPGVAEQLAEGTLTDGYVRIPTADYASAIAGGKLDAELLPHLKTDPEGKSVAEAQVFYQEQAQRMQDAARELVATKQQADAFRDSQARVQDTVQSQLNAVGRFTPDVNRVYAALHSAFISRLAARTGVTPEEAHATHGAQFAGGALHGTFDQATARTIEVGGARRHIEDANGRALGRDFDEQKNFWNWFGDSKATDENGRPLVVYHGTPTDFEAFDAGQGGTTTGAAAGRTGFFFTDRPDIAQRYAERAEGSPQIMPTYLSMKDPTRAEFANMKEADEFLAKGYEGDGAILKVGRQNVYAVKDPAQIKSAIGNDGSYDANDPSILSQEARGAFEPASRTISLLKGADLSTFVHETGHWVLDAYARLAAGADAPPEIRGDTDVLMKWFGVDSLEKWQAMSLDEQRPSHEKLARAFEAYVMEGKAPSHELQPVFQRMRAWMVNIYKALRGLNVELTPEVRGVFDRMLATDDAIRDAQAARVFEPLFKEKPEHLSDEEWRAYQELGAQATNDAVQEMQDKSLRDMKWLSNAKERAGKELRGQAREARRAVRERVEKEVAAEPIERAKRWLRAGEMTSDAGEEIKAGKGFRLSTEAVHEMYPESTLARPDLEKLRGMTAKDGLHPDLVAEMFGLSSGDALVRELTSGDSTAAKVEGLTDRRMLEEHGELSSPDAIDHAANEAVHNAARARLTATGLKVLTKSPISATALLRGAKEAADFAIARTRVGDLNPRQYLAAETKANREALRLVAKDPVAAAQAQRASLLNNQLVRSAYEAQDLVRKAVQYARSFEKRAKRLKIDPEDRDQIDQLLQRFDFRAKPPEGPSKKQVQLTQWVESQKALGYTPAEVADMLDPQVRMHYKDMSVEQLRGLMDTVRSVEAIGRARQRVTVDGKHIDVAEAVAPMLEKMKARGEKFTDAQLAERPRLGVDPLWRVTLDRLGAGLRAGTSELTRPDYKANKYDLHELLGPFQRAVTERLIKASYDFGDHMDVLAAFKKAKRAEFGLDTVWQKSLNEVVENHTLMDNALEMPTKRRLTRGDLIGIALHVGNESNFDKLVRGMQWQPEDVWRTLHGNMREKDWQAARLMGEMAGMRWEEMSAMNRRLGNDNPQKIEPRPFQTKFGEMPGWYAPVDYDPLRSRLGQKKAEERAVDPQKGLFGRDYYRADTTTNGSLNARSSGYHDFLDLNWRPVEKRITDTMRDLAYREALIDVHKIYTNKEFRAQFRRSYGPEEYEHFGDWLGRLVNSEVGDEKQSKFVAVMATSRRALVAAGVAFRVSTMLKHGSSAGAKSVGYFAGGGETYFKSRVAAMSTNYRTEVADALARFPEIRQRLRQQDRDFSQAVGSIFEPESLHGKAERFGHAGVAWLDFLTAVPTANAAYDWAVTEGIPKRLGGTGKPMSEADAITFASKVVREAHSSTNEASQSLLITQRNEAIKALTVLHGFMNNAFGQNTDMLDKLLHANGFGKPELLARFVMVSIVPALTAGWITFGGPTKDQSWLGWAFRSIVGEFAGMGPMVREVYQGVVEGRGDAGLPSWMRNVSDVYKAGKSVVRGAEGEPVKHLIKDVGNASGLLLPGLGQAGASAQFLYDVKKGDQHPETVAQWLRGLMSGRMEPAH